MSFHRILTPLSATLFSLAALGASPLTLAADATPAASEAARPQDFKMKLGDFTVVALSDGTLHQPATQLLIEDRPGIVKQLLGQAGYSDEVPISVNGFLIDTGKKRVLIDTGAGKLFGAGTGAMVDSLKLAGYTPAQVDEILITHLHPDHCGGLSRDGKAVFPNAVLRIDEREANYWLETAPADKGAAARTAVQPYQASGHFKPFAPGATLEPGITALADTEGHTPGHTAYRIESRGQALVAWGDTMHIQSVQFPDPKVTIHYDSTPAEAQAVRLKLMQSAADQQFWIAGAHLAFPGIGHIKADGKADGGYVWEPISRKP